MSQHTILVIDDSATIRKLVDRHLSSVGYRVVLAANAEAGLELAAEVQPDLVLLDHQLPGTTGYNVASQLAESEALRRIPVVISSTLRKKAYAEYIDLDNVVDMLPKPYTEDLLQTTVANAIETAAMIVDSQSEGSAVPEIIHALDEAPLTGNFSIFGLRELLDFLNNGQKVGVLEVEAGRTRIRFHLEKGRIQGVYAHGIAPEAVEQMAQKLPPSLTNLAPVLKMTVGGRSCTEVDGFVQLLDQKVLDPRLMSKLLRFQASMLVRFAFTESLTSFRFEAGPAANTLHRSLPLDISLLALLVEAAIYADEQPTGDTTCTFARRAIRGQNLDRAGLSARHMNLLNVLSEPKDTQQLTHTLGWNADEVHQVLHGFELAELVERRAPANTGLLVIYEPDPQHAQKLRETLESADNRINAKVVRDKLALQLILRRTIPHTLVFAGDDPAVCAMLGKWLAQDAPQLKHVARVVLSNEQGTLAEWSNRLGLRVDGLLKRPVSSQQLFATLDKLSQNIGALCPAVTTDSSSSSNFVAAGV